MLDDSTVKMTVSPAVAKAMGAFHSGRELLAENARLKAENERLGAILKEVRFFCTYDTYRADLHTKIWPLVVAFDNPPE